LLDHVGPRTIVLADEAYDADRIREMIPRHGATQNIPLKSIRKWKSCVSRRLYRERNLIERIPLKAEALPPRRDLLQQACRQLPRNAAACLSAAVAARLRIYDLAFARFWPRVLSLVPLPLFPSLRAPDRLTGFDP